MLGFPDVERKTFGVHTEKVYDDWDGIEEVLSNPESWGPRKIENAVIAASSKNPIISSAVVAPPL